MRARTLLFGTRKGLLLFEPAAGGWKHRRLAHEGIPVTYACEDARTGTLWASLDHGHWGQKLSRSRNRGETWEEVPAPTYPEGATVAARDAARTAKPAVMESIWVIQPGGADQPERLYLGTNPGGLFRSDDGGDRFELVRGLWDHPTRQTGWFGGGRDTPGIHSILVDPRDSRRLRVGISCGGVFESTDDGGTWTPRNRGLRADFLPDPGAEVGQDPHFVMACSSHPDVLWQQNHCGIWRSTDGAVSWQAIHQEQGPAKFGFPIAAHADDADTAWVVPGVSDEKRMAIDGALMVCRTEDGGRTWAELREGLPQENAFDVVYRHALDIDGDALAFGSTTGNAYVSADGGESWHCIGNNLPPVYSVRFASGGA
jgi:hypothetical protein